jgi:hypothetical protein
MLFATKHIKFKVNSIGAGLQAKVNSIGAILVKGERHWGDENRG